MVEKEVLKPSTCIFDYTVQVWLASRQVPKTLQNPLFIHDSPGSFRDSYCKTLHECKVLPNYWVMQQLFSLTSEPFLSFV